MEKILFALDVDDGWPPVGAEGVWCEKYEGHFKLKNAPFFIPNLACNDLFHAEPDSVNDQIFEFVVVERSGHSVIWFMNKKGIDISGLKSQLLEMGCNIETLSQFDLGTIDVPVGVNYKKLNKLVDLYEGKSLNFAFPVWNEP